MRARICAEPCCNAVIPESERRCAEHQKPEPIPFSTAERSNEGLYNTSRWRKLRSKVLKNHPHCVNCGERGSEVILEVHHIVPPRGDEELFFDEGNVIPVCPACHKRLTAMEINSRRTENWSGKPWPLRVTPR